MPSDAKKRQAARKKEQAKQRQQKKKTAGTNSIDDCGAQKNSDEFNVQTTSAVEAPAAVATVNSSEVGFQNGHVKVDLAAENACDENGDDFVEKDSIDSGDDSSELSEDMCQKLKDLELVNSEARSCTGVLASHPRSRDLKISSFSLTFYGREIISDTRLELNNGRRYGLVGLNGSEQCNDTLMDIYERLDELDSDTAEVKAAEILHGLGFSHHIMNKKCQDFSGGWRMRIALARALFVKPTLLLLDEPTNHLDLDACVWLEQELKNYKRILVIVSHSQDFLNGVCNNIIHLRKQKLRYYGGNYDTFVRTRIELLENQLKRFNWEQDQLKHMKDYVARFGHGSAKLARQAQSKEKTMNKMIAGGLTEKVVQEKVKQFYFFDPGYVPPPVIMVQHVSFRYGEKMPLIFKNLDFGIDLDTRVALVGPNGAGKSTLLKLLVGDVMPSDGLIRRHSHVKIGPYHQHLHEELPLEMSALEYMMSSYPEVTDKEQMRKIIGRYGITGRQQTCPMKQLSDGQRCRVSFSWLAWQSPHLLLLDEPTNHLDMESIDALADAINDFAGAMVLVSHDFRLVKQVADVVWVCDNQTIRKWEGDIFSYKEYLKGQIEKDKRRKKK